MKILGKTTLAGLPINIISEEDAEEVDFVLCVRCEDNPGVITRNSIKEECSVCNAPVWFSRTSPIGPKKICLHCMIKLKPKPNESTSSNTRETDSGTGTT